MDLRIIHDANNAASRDFVAANINIPLINWYSDFEARITLVARGISVSDFPTIVDMHSGLTVTKPNTLEYAESVINNALKPTTILKLTIVDRLYAAGKFDAAMAALAQNAYQLERWRSAIEISKDDPQVRGLLIAVGANPDEILA